MNYHNIYHDDMKNGDGLRVTVFVSGCNCRCPECQNPETWDPKSGTSFDDYARAEIFGQLNEDYISGITLTGGDPLFPGNRNEINELITLVRQNFPNKTIWVYTGHTFEDLVLESTSDNTMKNILENINVLVDGKYDKTKRDIALMWRGSSNQRVINVPESLKSGSVIYHCD